MANVHNSLNKLKTKVKDLDVGKLKCYKLVDKQVLKSKKLKTLKTKKKNLEISRSNYSKHR